MDIESYTIETFFRSLQKYDDNILCNLKDQVTYWEITTDDDNEYQCKQMNFVGNWNAVCFRKTKSATTTLSTIKQILKNLFSRKDTLVLVKEFASPYFHGIKTVKIQADIKTSGFFVLPCSHKKQQTAGSEEDSYETIDSDHYLVQ